MSSISVKILSERKYSINGESFIYPLIINKKLLNAFGISIDFINTATENSFSCNVFIITSNFMAEMGWWKNNKKHEIFDLLNKIKSNSDYVIWADLRDGTGTTFFEVLPNVDRYFKGFLLKDRSIYLKKLYASRVFTDYYHNVFNIQDSDPGEAHLNHIPEKHELGKVFLSWNNSYNNYNLVGSRIRLINSRMKMIPFKLINKMTDARQGRSVFYNCRIGTKYSRNTIAFPRTRILGLLNGKVDSKRLNKRKYYNELNQSRVVISPFGWGEACYRDYEALNAGAALLKPDCSHMETWPDYYINNETYIPYKWDFSDFYELITALPDKNADLISIAEKAQEKYKYFLFSEQGSMEFCERFKRLISF